MNDGNPISTPSSLVDKIKNILLKPKEEWPRIATEPASIGGIYTSWVMILAAIPAVCGLIGSLVFGFSALGITYRPSATAAVSTALVTYVLSLIQIFVLALIIDGLAPTFGGTKDRVQAFKVAAYSATAGWVGGVFQIIPALAALSILAGLYGIYLLYLGLPLLMKAPQDKAMGYTVVTIIVAIVLGLIVAALTLPVAGMFGGGLTPPTSGSVSGTVNVPGVGSVDMGKLEEASKQMEKAANSGPVTAADPSSLAGLLPASIGGFQRTSIENSSVGAGGFGGSQAEARYEAGGSGFNLRVTDMGAAGAFTGMAAAMNVNSSKSDANGYEKTSTGNGRLVIEKWNNADKSGTYSTTVANRFMVEAEGKADSIDGLKAAVASVDPTRLEALAK